MFTHIQVIRSAASWLEMFLGFINRDSGTQAIFSFLLQQSERAVTYAHCSAQAMHTAVLGTVHSIILSSLVLSESSAT